MEEKTMNNIQKVYLTKIKKALPTSKKVKRSYINELSQSVEEYCNEHANLTYEDICTVFGTPQDIAQAFLAEQDENQILQLKRHNKIKQVVILLFSAIIVCVAIWFSIFTANSRALNSIISNETVSINSQSTIDLSAMPVQISNSTQSGISLADNSTCTNASKTITYYDKDNNAICDCIITNEFIQPNINNYKPQTEPNATITIYNPKYSVQIKNLTYDDNCVNVILEFKYKNRTTEKVATFSCEEF